MELTIRGTDGMVVRHGCEQVTLQPAGDPSPHHDRRRPGDTDTDTGRTRGRNPYRPILRLPLDYGDLDTFRFSTHIIIRYVS